MLLFDEFDAIVTGSLILTRDRNSERGRRPDDASAPAAADGPLDGDAVDEVIADERLCGWMW